MTGKKQFGFRWVAALTVVLLLVCLFAGCKKTPEEQPTGQTTEQVSEKTTEQTSEQADLPSEEKDETGEKLYTAV